MTKVHCPYCEEDFEIYLESCEDYERFQQECPHCEKLFMAEINVRVEIRASKADCLNGAEHKIRFHRRYPQSYSEMACCDCDFSRALTDDEKQIHF